MIFDPSLIEQHWIVGAHHKCHVHVDDQYVSDKHCEVIRTFTGEFYIRDLGSTNGTWLVVPGRGRVRVQDWTQVVPGMTVVVGRSPIPWSPQI